METLGGFRHVSPWARILALVCAGALSPACGGEDAGPGTKKVVFGTDDLFDVPVTGLTAEEREVFAAGDGLFDLALRDYDGLGPLYTRTSCSACHAEGVRGPGLVQKMVVVESDGITPAADQSNLPFGHTVHPLMTAGATMPILPPSGDGSVKVTQRLGPPILGRGYMEAILDSEIERVAAEQAQRTDGISGRVNHVTYSAMPNTDTRYHANQPGDAVIGRFGLKARIATVDEFTADALQGDMGITSPLRPSEFVNPDGVPDDLKPGVDVSFESLNTRAVYVRMTAIPNRIVLDPRGRELFAAASCAACHVPTLKTRSDYPLAPLAGIDAPVYTDMLLHDLGDQRADGMVEGEASAREWRTAPLIGLRFNRTLMHDGIAHDVPDAVRAHAGPGSEANDSVAKFEALPAADKDLLVKFVSSL